jgi:hypothetical protein
MMNTLLDETLSDPAPVSIETKRAGDYEAFGPRINRITPIAPRPPKITLPPNFFPSEPAIRKRASVNGGDVPKAQAELIEQAQHDFVRLAEIVPDVTATIAADLKQAETLRAGAEARLAQAVEDVATLENLMVEHASERETVARIQAQHEAAVKTLASPAALELDRPELERLCIERDQLPAQVSEHQGRVDDLKGQIEAQAAKTGVAVPAMIEVIAKKVGHVPRPGSSGGNTYISDPRVHQLIQAGWMALE